MNNEKRMRYAISPKIEKPNYADAALLGLDMEQKMTRQQVLKPQHFFLLFLKAPRHEMQQLTART